MQLGESYETDSLGTGEHEGKAFAHFDRARKLNPRNADAAYALGLCYSAGRGTAMDERKAFECYRAAEELGSALAANAMAVCLQFGIGTNANNEEAVRYAAKAARAELPLGMFNFALFRLQGDDESAAAAAAADVKCVADSGVSELASIKQTWLEAGVRKLKITRFTMKDFTGPFERLAKSAQGVAVKCRLRGEDVVVKYSQSRDNEATISAEMFTELHAVALLDGHPNVLTMRGQIEYFCTPDRAFDGRGRGAMVFPFMSQGSVADCFAAKNEQERARRLAWFTGRDPCAWALQIARGVAHMHGKGVLHRDLAARNIFVHRNVLVVGDLGLARPVRDIETRAAQPANFDRGDAKRPQGDLAEIARGYKLQLNHAAVCLLTLAPEALQDGGLMSPPSDVWAFGLTLAEILSECRADALGSTRTFARTSARLSNCARTCRRTSAAMCSTACRRRPSAAPTACASLSVAACCSTPARARR